MIGKLLLAMALVGLCCGSFPIDLSQQNKYDNGSLLDTECNKDTQIDFFFNSDSTLAITAANTYTGTSGLSKSTMKFLDMDGNDLTLTLSSI